LTILSSDWLRERHSVLTVYAVVAEHVHLSVHWLSLPLHHVHRVVTV